MPRNTVSGWPSRTGCPVLALLRCTSLKALHTNSYSFSVHSAHNKIKSSGKKRSFEDVDDYLFSRSTGGHAAKKFLGDVVSGVGQKTPKYTSEHSQRVAHNDRMSRPGFAQMYDLSASLTTFLLADIRLHSSHNKIKSGKKRSFEDFDDYLFERSTGANAAKKFVGDVVSGVGQRSPKYASEYSQRVAFKDRMSRPGFAQM